MGRTDSRNVEKNNYMTSIVIVTYQSEKTIGRLLASIDTHLTKGSYEVIVVDNNSSDRTIEHIKKHKSVKLIEYKENKGFAFACHAGVNKSEGNYLLFLNPDILVKEDLLSPIVPMFKDTTIGVIGTTIKNADGSIQGSVRGFPTLSSHILITLKIHHLSENFLTMKSYFLNSFNYKIESDVDQVMGAIFFTPRKLWEKVGGFDKRFFIWFEEVDYCFQIKKLGFRVVYTPKTYAEHIGGASFSRVSKVRKQFWFFTSMTKYFLKNGL